MILETCFTRYESLKLICNKSIHFFVWIILGRKVILKKVLIGFLLGFLILVSVTAVVNATTINIDGDMADWAEVEPIFTDIFGDGENLNEDILSCYVTNDGSNLYFRIDVAGTVIPNTEGERKHYYIHHFIWWL